jgi:hypothetical protein
MGFGQSFIELNRVTRVRDGALEQVPRRFVLESCGFIQRKLGARQACIGQRIPGIERDGTLEVGPGRRELAHVEALELEPSLHERAVRSETCRFAGARAVTRRSRLKAKRLRQRHDNLILKVEDALDGTIDLRIGYRFAGIDVDDTRHDAN